LHYDSQEPSNHSHRYGTTVDHERYILVNYRNYIGLKQL